jgi:hypothetical protein
VARTYGVSSDYVTAFDVVTGDGTLRRASATEHPELFWGLRGGKGALGIVTAVEFDLVPLAELLGGCLYFHGEDAASVLHAWREWTPSLPEAATSSVAVVRFPAMPGVPEPLAGTVTVALRFAWVGDLAQGRQVLAPMRAAGRIVLGGIDTMPYAAIGMIHNDPIDPTPTHEASTLLSSLPAEAIDAIVTLAGPDAECPQTIVELRQLGGAIARARNGDSAFSRRDAAYSFLTIGLAAPPVIDSTIAHATKMLDAVDPWSDGTCLPTFQRSADPVEVGRWYNTATLRRLAEVADRYDPHEVIAAASPVRAATMSARAKTERVA